MNSLKSAVVFFLLFVGGSSLLRVASGDGLSVNRFVAILVMGLIAAGIFTAFFREGDKPKM